ncbi:hypothetical protein AVEN_49035-1 [Araneus ventricosus]|uniref:DUF5641 domain-containing protein n=1 Tax=Araneus ventricosus TaxID=182803 RepID=A0A4Y2QBL0_ARAVE|nr:hypothetical protein AVEN_49035-1 [Araneus ventricosus]
MPRLELLGALLAARLASKVKPIVDLKRPSKVFFWTDSKIILHWTKGSSESWKSFVSNRVTEIQSLCDTSAWAHCPGKQNPADFLSRGVNVEILLNGYLWWKEPQFLREVDFSADTGNDDASISLHDISDELKKTSDYSPLTLTVLNHNFLIDDILKISDNYMSIIRVMYYILRFIHNVKNIERLAGHLTIKELQRAEIYLVQLVQQGRPLSSVVEPDLLNISENRLSKWKKITKYSQQIWRLWKKVYLNTLQQRSKWMFSKSNVKLGALVLIKDENMPSVKCLTGRISEIIISKDEKLKLPTFDGNIKNWLGYWGQFKKIDTDPNLDDHDKFAYLLQSMEKGSSAEELIKSFPPGGESYSKALQQLQSRFVKEDLLIEVYIRDLLSLVLLKNSEQKFSLRKLYDNLESKLRVLEVLGVARDKYAAMLYPLFESSLPYDTLKA